MFMLTFVQDEHSASLAMRVLACLLCAVWVQSYIMQYPASHKRPFLERVRRTSVQLAINNLVLTEENARTVLDNCRKELQTMFGYLAENNAVGITGTVEFVELEGPIVVCALKGRFWHDTNMVKQRVKNYLTQRIPECANVEFDETELEE